MLSHIILRSVFCRSCSSIWKTKSEALCSSTRKVNGVTRGWRPPRQENTLWKCFYTPISWKLCSWTLQLNQNININSPQLLEIESIDTENIRRNGYLRKCDIGSTISRIFIVIVKRERMWCNLGLEYLITKTGKWVRLETNGKWRMMWCREKTSRFILWILFSFFI